MGALQPCHLKYNSQLGCLLYFQLWLLQILCVGALTIPPPLQVRNVPIPVSLQDRYYAMQHLNIWHTVDDTRPFIESLKSLPKDHWTAPPPSADEPLNLFKGQATGNVTDLLLGSAQCLGTLGTWCKDWWASTLISKQPHKRGNKECGNNCNGVGVCNYDIGICQCPAGWKGDDCTTPDKRPCAHTFRSNTDPVGIPKSSIDPITKEETDVTVPGWTASRCTGVCDDDIAACYCGWNSTHSRIPAPPNSPPGTPPIRVGRPLHVSSQASSDMWGRPIGWGNMNKDLLYGPNGWCNADKGKEVYRAGCLQTGLGGAYCDVLVTNFCPNQCNARGVCDGGFCKCDPGWYGTACDKLKEGATPEPVSQHRVSSWGLADVWKPVTQKGSTRRPLIYVYDLPAIYNSKLLQYRITANPSVWRGFTEKNHSYLNDIVYATETYLHEALLTSTHRTLNPEEADFFYVPVYLAVLIMPILGWADGPWWYAPYPLPRVMHATNMLLEVKRWLQQHHPWWDRRQGRDHIWFVSHDEGPCYVPNDIYNTSIIFSHWGRTDHGHVSCTAYGMDNYSFPMNDYPNHQAGDWRDLHNGHPCYTPGKDLVIPAFKTPAAWAASPLLGNAPLKRDILFFFRGDVGLGREWWYSRGIRQTLYRLAQEDGWREKYGILIGTGENYPGPYSQYLSRSKFCLVAMGDGWSSRSEDAVQHGCIPVLINDHVEPVLHGLLDWDSFSIRVPQSRIADLPQILLNITGAQLEDMQQALAKVWTRFAYVTGPWYHQHLNNLHKNNQAKWSNVSISSAHPYKPFNRFPVRKDAFHTIMQWLSSKIPYTLGKAAATDQADTSPRVEQDVKLPHKLMINGHHYILCPNCTR